MAKLTKNLLESKINNVQYDIVDLKEGPRMTLCFIIMDGGFVVTGQSACINTEDFDEALGKQYAYDQAFNKIWELEGYHQKSVQYLMGKD